MPSMRYMPDASPWEYLPAMAKLWVKSLALLLSPRVRSMLPGLVCDPVSKLAPGMAQEAPRAAQASSPPLKSQKPPRAPAMLPAVLSALGSR